MNNNSDNRKQLQLAVIMTAVMVPVIIGASVIENYYLLGAAIVVELVLIAWTTALARSAKQGSTKVANRE